MPQTFKLIAQGLDTSSGELSRPSGALSRAENVRILRDGVITPRRGYAPITLLSSAVVKTLTYNEHILALQDNGQLRWWDSTAWTLNGTLLIGNDTSVKVHSAEANKNLYLTTDDGVYKLDAYNGTPVRAGMPAALPFDFNSSGYTAGSFLADQKQVAYRHVLWKEDANGNRIVSAASGRMVVQNTSGAAADVTVEGILPSDAEAGWFVGLYRSIQTDLDVEPPDELGRVYELRLDASNITARKFTVVDSVPDALRDETLYVSPSQEGILQNNDRPPQAVDIATFKGCLFYGNTAGRPRFFLDILSVGGTDGIQTGDELNIGAETFTAGTDYSLITTLGSAALNNRATAQELCRGINVNSTDYIAHYLSGPDDFIGKVVIERRWKDDDATDFDAFDVYVGTGSKTACWNPPLAETTPNASSSSKTDTFPHGLYFSKQDEPEAVPETNYFLIGSASSPIRRIVPTRDSLFVLKDDGVWRINGTGPDDFTVTQVDASCSVVAPESVVKLGGRVWALTLQGVVAISESGVQLMGYPIETDILALMASTSLKGVLAQYAFAVGYESDHLYMLWVPTAANATVAARTYVYSELSKSWVTDTKSALCGHVSPLNDRLHLGGFVTLDGYVWRENKARDASDYTDDGTDIACVVEFSPDALGMPGAPKHFQEVALLFNSSSSARQSSTVTLTTENDSQSFTLAASTPAARALVPRTCRRGARLKIGIALTTDRTEWQLLGVSVVFSPYGQRVNK